MAGRGPTPKRSSERRRRNKDSKPEVVQVAAAPVEAPDLPADMHEIAVGIYQALKESGQSQFYEPGDWAYARLLVHELDLNLKRGRPITGPTLHVLLTGFNDLLVTERARRQMRLELERTGAKVEEQPAGVTSLQAFKQRAKGS